MADHLQALNSSSVRSPIANPMKSTSSKYGLPQQQESLLKSLVFSVASRVSGSVHESISSPKKEDEQATYTDKILQMSNNINTQVAELDQRLDTILEKHEKDFLTAYRYHMLKVQKELVQLKQKANEHELKSQQEQRIGELEARVGELRGECMKQRFECDDQDRVVTQLKKDQDELEDDRKFLEYELYDSRQQNRLLKITLSKTHNQCEELSQMNVTARDDLQRLTFHAQNQGMSQTNRTRLDDSMQQQLDNSKINQSLQGVSLMDKQTEMTTNRKNQLNLDKSTARQNINTYLEEASEDQEDERLQSQVTQQQQQLQHSLPRQDQHFYATFNNQHEQQPHHEEVLETQYSRPEDNSQQYQTSNQFQGGPKTLKYLTKLSKGFGDDRGPGDLKKSYLYNHKLNQQVFDVLDETRDKRDIALKIEQLFKEDFDRKHQVLSSLRSKLEQQHQHNISTQKRIEEQKMLVTQKKKAQVLIQTLKNCVQAVIADKKDRHGDQYKTLTKEQLFASDRKRILELFVENDNTLSHLLEFISSKLIDSEGPIGQSESRSSKSIRSSISRQIQQAPSNLDMYHQQRHSQMSGAGKVQTMDGLNQSTNVQLQAFPIQSYSSDRQSSIYLSQHHPQQRMMQKMNLTGSNLMQDSQIGDYQPLVAKDLDHLMSNSNQHSSLRTGGENIIGSKTTLRLAGQASLSKSSQFSGINESKNS